MKASDIVVDSNTSILMKSPPGFGKTLAAASFAVDGPIYIAYWDKKKPIELVHFFKRFRPELLDRITFDVYGAHNANEYLNKMMDLSKSCPYFAVITDSLTQMTSGAVNWSLGFRDNKKSGSKDRIIPDWDEYKVETSIATQALDISRTLPCHIIWTCHPVPGIKMEGSGNSLKITKTNSIVTYGSKVAGIVPGNFSEIYHFAKLSEWDANIGKSRTKYLVSFDAIGDDFAKSNIGLTGEIDITNALFYEVWKERIKQFTKELNEDVAKNAEKTANSPEGLVNPFSKPVTEPTVNQTWKT